MQDFLSILPSFLPAFLTLIYFVSCVKLGEHTIFGINKLSKIIFSRTLQNSFLLYLQQSLVKRILFYHQTVHCSTGRVFSPSAAPRLAMQQQNTHHALQKHQEFTFI